MSVTAQAAEPTLGDILRDIGLAWRWIACGLLFGLMAGILFLTAAVPQYRASMLVSPTTRSGTPDISALFPNNASFTMEYVLQSFGPGDSSDFMRFETIMREPTIAGILLRDEKIKRGLQDARRYRVFPARAPDTPEKLASWLQKNVDVEPVGATRLKRLNFAHPDPVFAAYMLKSLYKATDNLIRQELEEKTTNRVNWLRAEIERTDNPEHRRVLANLLMDQEQIRMILAVDEPFAASVAEPPAAGPRPYWPRRSLFLAVFVMVGGFAAYALFCLRRSVRRGAV